MDKCAQKLNLRVSEFYILIKSGPLPDNMYANQMKAYDVKEIQLERMPQDKIERDFPTCVIGNDDMCRDVFLDVLSNKNNEIAQEVIHIVEQTQLNSKVKSYLFDNILSLPVVPADETPDPSQTNFSNWQQIFVWNK